MFKKILFPTDFSSGSSHALSHAIRLADVREGEIIVQHVVSDYFESAHWTTIFDVHELQKHLDAYVHNEMTRILPDGLRTGLKIRKMISKGKPAPEISAMATEEEVDVVVMGPARGAVTSQVIETGTRPVFAIPAAESIGDGCERLRKILVATDFSNQSGKVVEYAFSLAHSLGASISMIYVIETTRAIEFALRQGFSDAVDRMRDWATHQLANITPDEFMADPAVDRFVEVGSPSDEIVRVAKDIEADVIVVGVHENGFLKKRLMGSNAETILRKSGSPILTLRA